MVECPYCEKENSAKDLFCAGCGAFLREDNRNEADPFPSGLKLTIPDSGRAVEVSLTKEVNIGRLDSVIDSFPEVDLTSEGGREKGISRRHAKITRYGNEVFIEDLGSTNGTCLNRKKLTPYLLQMLKSGDELQLGTLILWVSFT